MRSGDAGLSPAVLAFRGHSGWAALVALAGEARSPRVALRGRIDMADPDDGAAKQPYHAAEDLDLPDAKRLLKRLADEARTRARRGLGTVLKDLGQAGFAARSAVILHSSGRLPDTVEAILASHAFIHTADGEHFRAALAHACEKAGLEVSRLPEREALARAAAALRTPLPELQSRVEALGRGLGPPWTADQKLASAAAWLGLAAART
jgi:hypothetical protein